jgi:hypothetical protein
MTTINVLFDPTALPDWAQGDRLIVERCESDLGFRATVCATREGQPGHAQTINHLRRQTYQLRNEVADR